jgi:hypothetical protein
VEDGVRTKNGGLYLRHQNLNHAGQLYQLRRRIWFFVL